MRRDYFLVLLVAILIRNRRPTVKTSVLARPSFQRLKIIVVREKAASLRGRGSALRSLLKSRLMLLYLILN